MDLRHLRYFVTIAEEGQVTAAARRLRMAQPPLSRQLKEMEDELGVLLFERGGRQLTLTAEGEVLYRRAKRLLAEMDEAVAEVREMKQAVNGTLAVGATLYCATQLLQTVLHMGKAYPQITFKVWEGETQELVNLLETREIELAIVNAPMRSRSFTSLRLADDPFVLVAPGQWTMSQGGAVSLEEIARLPLILLRTVYGGGVYDKLIEQFHRHNLSPNVICECRDTDRSKRDRPCCSA
ncbi:LysR family transcriptional regulator [Alicyclobacillus herbarius]|uniref:LysR family transcriptional regulator n=1 Tax=Alicyclobacillus herbarius TaxID=122960 RepID=UPI000401AFD8|nr:LysR family transcriptional regulator [Alicyclobacillus herbarius]